MIYLEQVRLLVCAAAGRVGDTQRTLLVIARDITMLPRMHSGARCFEERREGRGRTSAAVTITLSFPSSCSQPAFFSRIKSIAKTRNVPLLQNTAFVLRFDGVTRGGNTKHLQPRGSRHAHLGLRRFNQRHVFLVKIEGFDRIQEKAQKHIMNVSILSARRYASCVWCAKSQPRF